MKEINLETLGSFLGSTIIYTRKLIAVICVKQLFCGQVKVKESYHLTILISFNYLDLKLSRLSIYHWTTVE